MPKSTPHAKSPLKSRPKKKSKAASHAAGAFSADQLLLAIVTQVPFDGWTMTALRNGAATAKVEAGRLELTYPRGVRDVVAAFSAWANQRMVDRIAADRFFKNRRVRDKIAFAVRGRLEALTPYREAVRQQVLWSALPHHAPDCARRVYDVCDLMWRQAGDTSTDFNFYSKRGLLAYVLKTTTLFWLNDSSEGQSATWQFLDRRIAEVLQLGQAAGRLKDLPAQFGKLGALSDIVRFFRRAA